MSSSEPIPLELAEKLAWERYQMAPYDTETEAAWFRNWYEIHIYLNERKREFG